MAAILFHSARFKSAQFMSALFGGRLPSVVGPSNSVLAPQWPILTGCTANSISRAVWLARAMLGHVA